MANDSLQDNQRDWPEGSSPTLTFTLVDDTGTPIALSNINSLTLYQWIDQGGGKPGKTINSRNAQDVKNAHNVTVDATSGLVTWSLQPADLAMQSKDTVVIEERHYFRFDLSYQAGGATVTHSGCGQLGFDYYTIYRKQVVS